MKTNFSKQLRLSSSAILGSFLFANAVGAATIYTDRTTFQTSTTGLLTESFEASFSAGPSVALTDLTVEEFSVSSFGRNLERSTNFVTNGTYGLDTRSDPSTYVFTFYTPITTFGIDIIDWGTNTQTASLSYSDNVGNTATIKSIPPALANGNVLFFGIYDAANPFTTVSIATGTSADRFGFDYLQYSKSSPVVPIPPAIWLFGSALTSLFALSRRKKTKLFW